MLVLEFLPETSQISLCSMSSPQVKIVRLPDLLHVPLLFGGRYLELKLFFFIVFYIVFVIIKILIVPSMTLYMLYRCTMAVAIVFIEFLLLSKMKQVALFRILSLCARMCGFVFSIFAHAYFVIGLWVTEYT
jgi:hypothetical protein